MADDRRVIFSSYMIAKESQAAETEGLPEKWIMYPEVGKSLGGKGINVDVDPSDNGFWTSMAHQEMNWEDWDGSLEVTYYWEQQHAELWDGIMSVDNTNTRLVDDSSTCIFFYIKHTGTENDLKVSLDDGASFPIIIPPGGSLNCRGEGAGVLTSYMVIVKATDASPEIPVEYIFSQKR